MEGGVGVGGQGGGGEGGDVYLKLGSRGRTLPAT